MGLKLVVLSGKGGTGKTLIATNLAHVLSDSYRVQLLDCDVEEPNDHIFFRGKKLSEKKVEKLIPVVDQKKCKHTGKCAAECQFGAIVSYPTMTMVLKKMCHGCGLCATICPEGAITEEKEEIGIINNYVINDHLLLAEGVLNIGEPSGVQIIRQLKKELILDRDIFIYDSPPGASCPVVETLRGADFALLVTESSPFGLHDLKMVLDIVEEMHIPHAVIINRYDENYLEMEEFLQKKKIDVLLKIPFSQEIAKIYSEGTIFSKISSDFFAEMKNVAGIIEDKVYERNRSC